MAGEIPVSYPVLFLRRENEGTNAYPRKHFAFPFKICCPRPACALFAGDVRSGGPDHCGKVCGNERTIGRSDGQPAVQSCDDGRDGAFHGDHGICGEHHWRGRQGESRTRNRHGHLYFRRSGGDRHSADSCGQRVSFRGHARPRIRLFRDELLYQNLRDRYNFYRSV